jgi:hypothetical protein
MFKILSDLTLILRKELSASTSAYQLANSVLASGLSGIWVTLDGAGEALVPGAGGNPAWAVWNESSRDNTAGTFTADVTNNKKVTVLCGKYFATTDRYSGSSPTLGSPLYVAAGGTLSMASSGAIVAYCTKAPYATTTTNGTAVNVIDIYVI